jgi:hypothetical protein
MSSSSSTLNSDSGLDLVRPARQFCLRLARFLAPLALIGLLAVGIVIRTGELLPVSLIARLQTFNRPFIYLPQFSDHTYQLKIDAIRLLRPDVLVMGASRANQWRSAMFKPQTFYNAANCLYTQYDYRRMLEELGDYAPRVIIFSVDFYTFNNAWDPTFASVSYGDLGGLRSAETATIGLGLLKTAKSNLLELLPNPREPLLREPAYGMPALGLMAARSGTGSRIDGSYQYGARIRGEAGVSLQSAIERIAVGRKPFQPGRQIDEEQRREFERFVDLARKKGIALIGVTSPFAPPLVEALDHSPQHGIWKQFQSPEFADWIRRQGVTYFNFTHLQSFAGKVDEFVDPFHPSEPAHIRMLLAMLHEPAFRTRFPNLDTQSLEARLEKATPLEAYRNEF